LPLGELIKKKEGEGEVKRVGGGGGELEVRNGTGGETRKWKGGGYGTYTPTVFSSQSFIFVRNQLLSCHGQALGTAGWRTLKKAKDHRSNLHPEVTWIEIKEGHVAKCSVSDSLQVGSKED